MRILILGAGGIGGYFGARLASAGVDVSFLVRTQRAELLARQGLVVISPLGDVRVPVKTLQLIETSFDAVLLSCKAYDLDSAMDAIAPAIKPSTLILPLLNGVRHLDNLDARFGRDHVLGGLAHIGVTLNEKGEIRHLNTQQGFTFGARTDLQQESATSLHATLAVGGFSPILSDAIMQEMWEKFTFLVTYAGMTTLMRATVGAIISADEGEAITREMLEECVATAKANNFAPRPAAIDQMVSTLTERNSSGTASMFRDMAHNGPTEHEHIIGDMLTRARAAGVPAPLLRVSLANMQAYNAARLAVLKTRQSPD